MFHIQESCVRNEKLWDLSLEASLLDPPSVIPLNASLVGHDTCTMILVHTCTVIIVHAFTMIIVHVSCLLGLTFDAIQIGNPGGGAPWASTEVLGAAIHPSPVKNVSYGSPLEDNAHLARWPAGNWSRDASQMSDHQIGFMFNVQSTRRSSSPRGSTILLVVSLMAP